jgi:hypothetical protein
VIEVLGVGDNRDPLAVVNRRHIRTRSACRIGFRIGPQDSVQS